MTTVRSRSSPALRVLGRQGRARDRRIRRRVRRSHDKPLNDTELEGDDAVRMQKLLDASESLDDVQEINKCRMDD